MLNFLYQTMSHLWFGLAVFLIIFFICSRTAFFQTTLFQQNYSLKNKLHIIAFFSLLGILNTYWSLYGESWLINTSSIFIIVAGLVSGPLIGFCTSLLISVHYVLFIHTKAALMTRGITEIGRLGVALGASASTFAGLTGIGDLIVTCTSMHSRNRRAGILIGQGVSPEEAVKLVGTVEGYNCCKVALELANKVGVSMPITEQLNNVLFNKGNVKEALGKLMSRPKKCETEEII